MQQCKTAWGASSFACTRNGSVLLIGRLLTQYEAANHTFCDMAARMLETLQQKYPATRLFIGVGHCHKKIADLRSSYYQAKTALLAAMSHSFHNDIVYYDQLGIYKILFDIRNRDNAYIIRNELIIPIPLTTIKLTRLIFIIPFGSIWTISVPSRKQPQPWYFIIIRSVIGSRK